MDICIYKKMIPEAMKGFKTISYEKWLNSLLSWFKEEESNGPKGRRWDESRPWCDNTACMAQLGAVVRESQVLQGQSQPGPSSLTLDFGEPRALVSPSEAGTA